MTTEHQKFSISSLAAALLIFLSVLPYASKDLWSEAMISAVVFLLSIYTLCRNSDADKEVKQLIAPIIGLAIYSFIQGFSEISMRQTGTKFFAALPRSFDSTASFWNGIKFLSFALLLKYLSVVFKKNPGGLVWILIVTGSFYALTGIFRFALQNLFPQTFSPFLLSDLLPNKGFGTFINQNHFAFLMVMCFGLSLGITVYGSIGKKFRLLAAFTCAAAWTAIVLTASRGGIISSFAAVAVLLIIPPLNDSSRYGRKNFLPLVVIAKRLPPIAAIIAFLVWCVFFIGQDRVIQRFETISAQFEGVGSFGAFRRIDAWEAAVSIIKEHGVYGVGFGGFKYAVSKYINVSGISVPEQVHNDYLELAVSSGIVGVFFAVWFLYKLIAILRRRFSESSGRFEYAARAGAMCGIAGAATHSFFDFGLQTAANQIFLAGILSVAIYTPNTFRNAEKKTLTEKSALRKFFLTFVFAVFFFLCLFFGATRLQTSQAINNPDSFENPAFLKIPFDAEPYIADALIFVNRGNYIAAGESLKQAAEYRPEDYSLQLRAAKVLEVAAQNEEAEKYFRQAVGLAPFYGEPHYFYGNFLVARNRKSEGYDELRAAVRRNPYYFDSVLNFFWNETNGNAAETVKLISVRDMTETERLAAFLFDKKEFAAVAELTCEENALQESHRDGLIRKLLEKRQYFYAFQVSERECDSSKVSKGKLADGNFSAEDLLTGEGFGWRVGNLPDSVKIGFNQTADGEDKSLIFIFEGDGNPSEILLSQLTVVEKKHLYRLSFDYRAEKIVTGGIPVLQLIFRYSDGDFKYKEIPLFETGDAWAKTEKEIQTDSRTEALEIRLTRQSCNSDKCPVFGRLLTDNFILK